MHSQPAPPIFFGYVKISLYLLIPLFMAGSVHSGSMSWEDWGQVFPDQLHVSLFPTLCLNALLLYKKMTKNPQQACLPYCCTKNTSSSFAVFLFVCGCSEVCNQAIQSSMFFLFYYFKLIKQQKKKESVQCEKEVTFCPVLVLWTLKRTHFPKWQKKNYQRLLFHKGK